MFLSLAYAQAQKPAPQASPMISFFPIILIFAIFYFLLIRPQQKKEKEHRKMLTELKKNDSVITQGGIYGTVSNVKDKSVVLKIADNVKIEVLKSAVAHVVKKTQETQPVATG